MRQIAVFLLIFFIGITTLACTTTGKIGNIVLRGPNDSTISIDISKTTSLPDCAIQSPSDLYKKEYAYQPTQSVIYMIGVVGRKDTDMMIVVVVFENKGTAKSITGTYKGVRTKDGWKHIEELTTENLADILQFTPEEKAWLNQCLLPGKET